MTDTLSSAIHHTLHTFYKAFSTNDGDLLAASVTADWDDIPLAPGQGPGPEGAKMILAMLAEGCPDAVITIDDVVGHDSKLAVRSRLTGTHKGMFFGIAATGKTVDLRLHEFHEFEGTRIRRTWHMEDWLGLFMQIGFPPAR